MSRPLGVDLFAGAGGLSLSFEQAGFDVIAAVEIDPIHCAVHEFNLPNCAVIPKSISLVSGDEIRQQAGIGKRKIDVVFGGAPCQGFSLIGHRILEDPRNHLVRDFVRIISELKPAYFVFENVKGLTVGKHKKFLTELLEAFGEIGYNVRSPWKVLNAADFGTPQNRERLFLLGAQKGRRLPEYPVVTVRPSGSAATSLLPAGPSCRDALDDLPDAEAFTELLYSDEVKASGWGKPSIFARELRCMDETAWHFGYKRNLTAGTLTSSARTDHSDISRRRFRSTEPGTVEPISRFFRLPPNGLSNTLRAGTDASRGAFTSPRPIHYALERCITVREMARLHGFPDWFRFHETKWHGARQIGNSVPPPLGRAVAAEVMIALAIIPKRPHETVMLGKPILIRMNMNRAAAYFEIPVLAGKRDRKSGNKKRKQYEIEGYDRPFTSLERFIEFSEVILV